MTDQQQGADERVNVDEIPLVIAVNYYDESDDERKPVSLTAGAEPFILFQMKQEHGAVVLDVTASMIPGEDDLIETLEVFFETMLAEREQRKMAALGVVEGEVLDEQGDTGA